MKRLDRIDMFFVLNCIFAVSIFADVARGQNRGQQSSALNAVLAAIDGQLDTAAALVVENDAALSAALIRGDALAADNSVLAARNSELEAQLAALQPHALAPWPDTARRFSCVEEIVNANLEWPAGGPSLLRDGRWTGELCLAAGQSNAGPDGAPWDVTLVKPQQRVAAMHAKMLAAGVPSCVAWSFTTYYAPGSIVAVASALRQPSAEIARRLVSRGHYAGEPFRPFADFRDAGTRAYMLEAFSLAIRGQRFAHIDNCFTHASSDAAAYPWPDVCAWLAEAARLATAAGCRCSFNPGGDFLRSSTRAEWALLSVSVAPHAIMSEPVPPLNEDVRIKIAAHVDRGGAFVFGAPGNKLPEICEAVRRWNLPRVYVARNVFDPAQTEALFTRP